MLLQLYVYNTTGSTKTMHKIVKSNPHHRFEVHFQLQLE